MADMTGSFTWYGHSCVELRTPGGKTLIFDPWFSNPTSPRAADDVKQCDLMLVSHGHYDHMGSAPREVDSSDALKIARATKPTWVCIHELSLWLETPARRCRSRDHRHEQGRDRRGARTQSHDGPCRPLGRRLEHDRARAPCTWASQSVSSCELEDGMRIYYAGDTDVFGDMKFIADLHRPDIAFLPMGGHFTMGPAGAARAAALLGRARGGADPLRHVPDPGGHAGPAARRTAQRWRFGRCDRARPRRFHSPALMRIRVADPALDAGRVAGDLPAVCRDHDHFV